MVALIAAFVLGRGFAGNPDGPAEPAQAAETTGAQDDPGPSQEPDPSAPAEDAATSGLAETDGPAPGTGTPAPLPDLSTRYPDGLTVGTKIDSYGISWRDTAGDLYTGWTSMSSAPLPSGSASPAPGSPLSRPRPPCARRCWTPSRSTLVVGADTITDDRKDRVQFAGPYLTAGQDLVVTTGSGITTVEDLDGRTLCIVAGSTDYQFVTDLVPGVRTAEYGTYDQCLEALTSGDVDAVTQDDAILAGWVSSAWYAGKLTLVGSPFTEAPYGIGLPKGDTYVREAFNEALRQMWNDGTMEQLVEANLGASGYAPRPDLNPRRSADTAAEPC